MLHTRPTGWFARLVRSARPPLQVAVAHHGGTISAWGWNCAGTASAVGVLSLPTAGRELLDLAVADIVATLPRWRTVEVCTADRTLGARHRGLTKGAGVSFRIDLAATVDVAHGLDRHPEVVARMRNIQAVHRTSVTDTDKGAMASSSHAVVVACDGSYSHPGRIGAWAWRTAGGRHGEGIASVSTSMLCELEGFVRALEELDAPQLVFVSDCETIVHDVRQMLATGTVPSRLSCTANGARSLWERARQASAGRTITIGWVRGHSGHELHGHVDRTARRLVRVAVRAAERASVTATPAVGEDTVIAVGDGAAGLVAA